MSTNDEFLNLLVQIKGAAALGDLKKALSDVGLEEKNLKALFDQNAIAEDMLVKETLRLSQAKADLKNKVEQLEQGIGKTTNKMAGFGQSALQTGRVVQDFTQGGLGGILNNIEGLSIALGGGPGLAGILTIVGVGFLLLKPQIEEVAKSLGLLTKDVDLSKSSVERLTERIKELTEKPHKLAIDLAALDVATAALERFKKGTAALDALGDLKSDDQKEAGARVTEAIAKTGEAKKIRNEIIAAVMKDMEAGSGPIQAEKGLPGLHDQRAEAQARFERTGKEVYLEQIANLDTQIKEIEKNAGLARADLEKQAGAKGGEIFDEGRAGTSTAATNRLADLLAKLGRKDLAETVAGATPDAVRVDRLNREGVAGHEAGLAEARKIKEENKKAAEDATNFETKHEEEMRKFAEKRADDERKGADKVDKEHAKKAQERRDSVVKGLEGTDLDEQAAILAAQFRGGLGSKRIGREGEAVPLSQKDQFNKLTDMIRAEVHEANPRMGKADKDLVAQQMARSAFKTADETSSQVAAEGAGRGMDKAAHNEAVLMNTVDVLMDRLRQAESKLGIIAAEAARQNARARTLAPTRPGT